MEESLDLLRVLFGDAHVGHGCSGLKVLRVHDPLAEILRVAGQHAGNIGALRERLEGWFDLADCSGDIWNQVAGGEPY